VLAVRIARLECKLAVADMDEKMVPRTNGTALLLLDNPQDQLGADLLLQVWSTRMSVDIIGGSLTFRCGHRVGVPLRLSLRWT
jgi:hypothetical protein